MWQEKFGGQTYTEFVGTSKEAGKCNPFWVIGRLMDMDAAYAEGEERRQAIQEAKYKKKK